MYLVLVLGNARSWRSPWEGRGRSPHPLPLLEVGTVPSLTRRALRMLIHTGKMTLPDEKMQLMGRRPKRSRGGTDAHWAAAAKPSLRRMWAQVYNGITLYVEL